MVTSSSCVKELPMNLWVVITADFIVLQDYVILDEGHKIKNPTKTTKGINAVGAKHRIILTGTPIQNNLKVN